MIINDIKKRLGTIVPKDVNKLTVECSDLVLKNKLETILKQMHINLSNEVWDVKDCKDFLKQLSSMEIVAFKNLYLEILEFIVIPKDELCELLRGYDEELELHLFDDERIFNKTSEIVKKEDGTEEVVKKENYIFVPHVFTLADLPRFFQLLSSKIVSFYNIIIRKYDETINENKSLDYQRNELSLLIEMINESNPEIISLIEETYLGWFNKIPKDSSIYLYLNKLLPTIIINNKVNIKTRLADVILLEDNIHRNYLMQRQKEYMNNMAKNKARK